MYVAAQMINLEEDHLYELKEHLGSWKQSFMRRFGHHDQLSILLDLFESTSQLALLETFSQVLFLHSLFLLFFFFFVFVLFL
jgi:hypothetical protein